jgi:hypothetical protein
MTSKNSRTLIASAVSLALSGMMAVGGLNAAVINADNLTGVGAWNLGNVEVKLYHEDGTEFGSFDKDTGAYTAMVAGDSFASLVSDATDPAMIMARVTGKIWPVGEPTGIKAVNNDTAVNNGKPQNCLINTAYLEGAYLDSGAPKQVLCSSPFQSHKRFKVAMQPATVDRVGDNAESDKPIDLVFDVDDSTTLTPYQVFSKINNYTGKRLKGYRIVVGKGVGANFKSASELGIASQLYLSLGVDEGVDKDGIPDGVTDLFEADDGLATFSHGLFGPKDKHFPTDGYFDNEAAGFSVDQGCISTVAGACPTAISPKTVATTDTIFSTGPLPSFYADYFREWLPEELAPKGIFWNHDSDDTTDPILMAWWNGTQWVKPDPLNDDGTDSTPSTFIPVPESEVNTWAADPLYYVDIIEDVLNLGLNYIVKVGDIAEEISGAGPQFTIRIIPVVGDQSLAAPWMENAPANGDLLPVGTTPSSSGGGCAIGGDGRFDPTLPALAAAGLVFFGLRRFKASK